MYTEVRIPPRDNSLLLQYKKIITKNCNAHNVRMSVGRIGGARCPVNKMTEISLVKGDAENARHENAGLENATQSCRGWKMQEWKKREKKSMTHAGY